MSGEEKKPEQIAMTAPVLMSGSEATAEEEKERSSRVMSFILPQDKYTRVEEAPVPTNAEVRLRQIEEHLRAVVRYSGSYSQQDGEERAQKIYEAVKSSAAYQLAQGETFDRAGFNPPFTLPWLRTNEVQVPIAAK